MKGFSNQLMEKHRYLKYFLEYEGGSFLSVEKVKSEFDRVIDLQQFLNVAAGLHPATAKVSGSHNAANPFKTFSVSLWESPHEV